MTRVEELRQRAAALLAKAERIETNQKSPRAPKVLLSTVRDALAAPLGMKPETIQFVIRRLKEAGVRGGHGFGYGASECPPATAIMILVATLSSATVIDCAAPTKTLLSAECVHRSGKSPSWLENGVELSTALATLLDRFIGGCPSDVVFSVDRTHLTASISVVSDSASWEAIFGDAIDVAGDRVDCSAVSGRTIDALASLYRGRE